MSLRSDRWDLVARRVYGRLDDDTLGTLARANRDLPFAFDEDLTLRTPPVTQLRAGGTFQPTDLSVFPLHANVHRPHRDYDPDDFDPDDFLV